MDDLHGRLMFKNGKQKELLNKYIIYKDCSSQKDLADLLHIKRATLKNWLNEKLTLPIYTFESICSEFKEANQFRKFIIHKLSSNWGCIKGGNIRKKQMGDIKKYYQLLRIKKEKQRFYRHLILKKQKKIKNKIVLNLIKKKINLKCLLATYILTDGSLSNKNGNYRISFYTKDVSLKDMIYDILLKESNYVPSMLKAKDGVYRIRVSDNDLAKKLLKINSSYKKIPSKKQQIKDYFKEKQPSLKFIKTADKKTQIWCIRLALSTDGYISLSKNGNYDLGLTCYHHTLCNEWVEVLGLINIKSAIIKRKDSWCEFSGIRINRSSIPLFWSLGGFIDGVKISKKSKKYKGLEKNKLLEKIIKERYGAVA